MHERMAVVEKANFIIVIIKFSVIKWGRVSAWHTKACVHIFLS